jgi:hypothetical protein
MDDDIILLIGMSEESILISIETRLKNIEESLAQITEALKPVSTNCNKMEEHISFVERTYASIKGPLSYFITTPPITTTTKQISDK